MNRITLLLFICVCSFVNAQSKETMDIFEKESPFSLYAGFSRSVGNNDRWSFVEFGQMCDIYQYGVGVGYRLGKCWQLRCDINYQYTNPMRYYDEWDSKADIKRFLFMPITLEYVHRHLYCGVGVHAMWQFGSASPYGTNYQLKHWHWALGPAAALGCRFQIDEHSKIGLGIESTFGFRQYYRGQPEDQKHYDRLNVFISPLLTIKYTREFEYNKEGGVK